MGRQVEGGRHFPVLFPGREKPGQVSRLQRGPSRQGRRGERRCMEPGLGEGRGLGSGSGLRSTPGGGDQRPWMEPSARGGPAFRQRADGARCAAVTQRLLLPSLWVWLCFSVLLILQVALETYGCHVPRQRLCGSFPKPRWMKQSASSQGWCQL